MDLKSKILGIKPPKIATMYVVIMYGVRLLLGERTFAETPYRIMGICIFAAGFSLMMWAVLLFKKNQTPLPPAEAPTALVLDGPYRFSRNPIYIGMTTMLIGISFTAGSLLMLVAPIAFFMTINFVFIPYEENKMLETFGDAYASFKKTVRRWI